MIVIERNGLLLEEVFNATGRWLYGSEWDGRELFARKLESPEAIRDKRQSIEAEIAEAEAPGPLLEELQNLPGPTKSYIADYDRYERQQRAEKVVIDALAKGELTGACLGGTVVPMECWAGEEDGFQYCLELGFVELPEHISSKREHSVRIAERAFIDWIEGVRPVRSDPDAPLSPVLKARLWLREIARDPKQRQSKSQLEQEIRAEIPELSGRGFDEAWRYEAPPHWRKPGRRPDCS